MLSWNPGPLPRIGGAEHWVGRRSRDSLGGDLPWPRLARNGIRWGRWRCPSRPITGPRPAAPCENFQISPLRFPRPFIRAMGLIKKAAAQVNMDLGCSPPSSARPIVQAAQAVADGQHDDQFVLDIFQTGSGTSTNMNTNEVIAGVANERFNNGVRGGKTPGPPQRRGQHGPVVQRRDPDGHPRRGARGDPETLDPGPRGPARAARREGPCVRRTSSRSAGPTCRTRCRSAWGRNSRATPRRSSTASGGSTSCSESLAELPIGGTAVGTGINTHAEFPQRMAALLEQGHRPGVPAGDELLRGDGQPRRGRRGLGRAQDGRHQPLEHRQQHPLARLGAAVRHRRDQDPRAPARQLDHARQGQPGDPRGRA